MIPGYLFTGFAKLRGFVNVKNFWLDCQREKRSSTLFCFLRSFCFARIRLNPLSGKILYHDCVSVIVSRFTFLIEDFVICCHQVTKICCSRCGCVSAFSTKRPCNFGPLTDLAISVLREVFKDAVLTGYHIFEGSCLRVHRLMLKLLLPLNVH